MQTARQAASAFKKQYSIHRVTLKALSDAVAAQGYTIVFYNAVDNKPDVASLIQALGLDAYIRSQKGFTYENDKCRLVFLHEDLSENEQLLVLAHELGHIFCGHLSLYPVIGRDVQQEHQANEFAHYLLYPTAWERMKLLFAEHKRALLLVCACLLLTAASVTAGLLLAKENSYYGEYYVTVTGNKYHKKNCMFVRNKTNISRLTKEDLESGEYEPCEVCLS